MLSEEVHHRLQGLGGATARLLDEVGRKNRHHTVRSVSGNRSNNSVTDAGSTETGTKLMQKFCYHRLHSHHSHQQGVVVLVAGGPAQSAEQDGSTDAEVHETLGD